MIFPHRNIFIAIFSLIGIVSGLIITEQVKMSRPTAGLKVETSLKALVYVDNKQIGVTPFDEKLAPGEVLLKLIPENASLSSQIFQTKIRLTDKTITLVRREFTQSELTSAGDTVTLTPISGQTAPLSIVSDPDSASVHINSQPQGFTPLNLESLTPGVHQIDISAPGYKSRSIGLRAVAGHRLQMVVKLAGMGEVVSLPEPVNTLSSDTPLAVSDSATSSSTLVRILSTPTGFLRVRAEPTVSASEVGRVNPGDRLPLVDTKPGWYKVSLVDTPSVSTSSGWISADYSSLES